MPRLSLWFLRAALLWLAVGFTVGGLLLWNKAWTLGPLIWRLLPLHMEALLVGWMVQLALGVSFWILPRWQNQRGDERPAWAALLLLNVGVTAVVLAPWLLNMQWLSTLGRSLEAAAAAAYVVHAWPRIKPLMETP